MGARWGGETGWGRRDRNPEIETRRKRSNIFLAFCICFSTQTAVRWSFVCLFVNIYLAALVLDVACGILFPDQGLNSWPPACDLGVLVIGPPGQPPGVYVYDGGLES